MGPASEQQDLDTIESELQTANEPLAGALAVFTRFAGRTRMSGPERLSARHWLITCVPCWRPGCYAA